MISRLYISSSAPFVVMLIPSFVLTLTMCRSLPRSIRRVCIGKVVYNLPPLASSYPIAFSKPSEYRTHCL